MVVGAVSLLAFLIGILFTTQGGSELLDLVDTFAGMSSGHSSLHRQVQLPSADLSCDLQLGVSAGFGETRLALY